MTPAHSNQSRRKRRETANPTGCLSGFLIPPLAALCLGLMFAALVGGGTTPAQFESAIAAQSTPPTNAINVSGLAPLFTPEIQFWAASIVRWAAAAGVDPNLAATVMQIESCGDPQARSSAGAMGLFQVMPFHFHSGEDPYDPDTNARRGLDYLRRSQEQAGGNPALAFAGYNGGISVIARGDWTWAHETQRYAYWGSGIYADAQTNAAASARLAEWLAAGGASLCRKAHESLGLP